MKFVLIAAAVGAAITTGVVQPADWWTTYREMFPSDPVERRALDQCFTLDAQFNRFDAREREACYRHAAPALAAAAQGNTPPRPTPAANFVDLWRSAGQGRMPRNDIRAEQQNDRFTHPPTIRGMP